MPTNPYSRWGLSYVTCNPPECALQFSQVPFAEFQGRGFFKFFLFFVAELKTALESEPRDQAKRLLHSQATSWDCKPAQFEAQKMPFNSFQVEKSQLSTWVGKESPEPKNPPLQENDPYVLPAQQLGYYTTSLYTQLFLIRCNLCNPARIQGKRSVFLFFQR